MEDKIGVMDCEKIGMSVDLEACMEWSTTASEPRETGWRWMTERLTVFTLDAMQCWSYGAVYDLMNVCLKRTGECGRSRR